MKALEEEDDDFDEENCKLFVRALAITFNSWMNVKVIAWSTVNSIVTEVFESYRKGVEFTKSKIRRKLLESGIREDEVKVIMSAVTYISVDLEDTCFSLFQDKKTKMTVKLFPVVFVISTSG